MQQIGMFPIIIAIVTALLAFKLPSWYLRKSVNKIWSAGTRSGQSKTTVRALPSLWYRSPELYELERRAIFSRKWILVTHKLRFTQIGEWIRFSEAGFSFLLCKDRQGHIQGFHNILACKYHGWSYGLNGSLAKAPGYQDIEGFDKSRNSLLPIHVHIDAHGFIWVNLDAAEKPEVAWSDDFAGVDKLPRHAHFDFDEYKFDHMWGMSGDYNWKTLADNYNECYHCPTTHPDAAALADLHAYKVETKGGNIEHFAKAKPETVQDGMEIVSNYYFPNACMTVSPNFFYIMRCVPTAVDHCSMEYEVYRHKDASDQDFTRIDEIFKRILGEDKVLCNNAQRNLNAGVFLNGEMHPSMEKGPLFFQQTVRDLLQGHRRAEEASKQEIWPAAQNLPKEAIISRDDVEFCSALACKADDTRLQW